MGKYNLNKVKSDKMNINKFLKDESAVTSIEYALIACLVALVILPTLFFTGNRFSKVFKEIAKLLEKVVKRSRK